MAILRDWQRWMQEDENTDAFNENQTHGQVE